MSNPAYHVVADRGDSKRKRIIDKKFKVITLLVLQNISVLLDKM